MTRVEAINYLKSSGMSEEQINEIASAFTCQEIYNKGWKDGAEATAYHIELCEEENPTIPLSVIEDIKTDIKLAKYASKDIPERALIYSNGWDDALEVAIDVIDKHIGKEQE